MHMILQEIYLVTELRPHQGKLPAPVQILFILKIMAYI